MGGNVSLPKTQTATLGFNGSARLNSATLNGATAGTYTYNGLEQRAVKTAGGATTDLLYDPSGHVLAEANDATGTMLREYIWMDDLPVAMVDDTGASPVIYYIHADQLGKPQKLTNSSANIVWDGVFDPFGNVTSLTGTVTNNLRFPGQYYDAETQLSQNWNRDYDPTIGRYVESDPLGLLSGVNTYAYVGSNPLRYLDWRGLSSSDDAKRRCKRNDCIDRCSDLALPTSDYGVAFRRCVDTCMGLNRWPEWAKYFPEDEQPETPPTPQNNSRNVTGAALGAAAGVGLTWATIEAIAAGFAVAF